MWRTRRVVAVGCAVRGVGPQPAGLAAPLTTCGADWRDEETHTSREISVCNVTRRQITDTYVKTAMITGEVSGVTHVTPRARMLYEKVGRRM